MSLIIYKMVKNEKGYAIFIALTISLILFILGMAIFQLTDTEIRLTKKTYESAYAYYLADAGINHAMWNLGNLRSPNVGSAGSPIIIGNGKYYVEANYDLLTSVGVYEYDGKVTKRTITVRYVTKSYPMEKGYAIYAAKTPSLPEKVYFYNATTDSNRVVIVDTSSSTLNIHGYVFSTETPTVTLPNTIENHSDIGYVWCQSGSYQPTRNVGTHFRKYLSTPELILLNMNTGTYDAKLLQAKTTGTPGNTLWSGITSLNSGEVKLFQGNLTITGEVTAGATVPSDTGPAYVVVYGTLKFDGNAKVSCPYVKFMAAGGSDTTRENIDSVIIRGATQFTHNVEVYSRSDLRIDDDTNIGGFIPTSSFSAECHPEKGGSSFLSKGKIQIDEEKNSYPMNMAGIFWSDKSSGKGISISTGSKGGTITIRGGLISPSSQISFSDDKLIKVYFREAFRPSDIAEGWTGNIDPVLNYTTWRE